MNKGRFREFYQCDFDIAGSNYGTMVPDAEILKIVVEVLNELNIGTFLIKLNHRLLLDAIIELSDISNDKFKTVCSSVDKLDKETWETVQDELIKKGITQEQCNKLHKFVLLKNSTWELLKVLKQNEALLKNTKGGTALKEFEFLFEYLDIFGVSPYVSFDLSLARGLDYYTGLIYEVILTDKQIGSISGGGRFDELVGMFSGKQIPSVGVSFGVERIFHILEENYKKDLLIRENETEVVVASIGKNMIKERLRMTNELWGAGIKVLNSVT
jgi:histidyl-tRNA synthetase